MVLFITILKYNAVDTLFMDFRGSPMIVAHNETQACHKSFSANHSIPVTQLRNESSPAKIMIFLKILFFHLTGILKLNRQLLP